MLFGFDAVCCSLVRPRFFVVVLLAFVVNVLVAVFTIQRRAFGVLPRYLLDLLEVLDCNVVLEI